MKAYIAHDCEGEESVVVFGTRNNMALRRQAAGQMTHGEVESIERVLRAPQFDRYAEQGFVPPPVLIEGGWQWGCSGCERVVNRYLAEAEDEETGELLGLDGPIWKEDRPNSVWCSTACRDADLAERAERKATEERETQESSAAFLAKFPNCEVLRVFRRDYFKPETLEVSFRFPGQETTWGIGTWKPSSPGFVNVPQADVEAWKRYADQLDRAIGETP